MQLFSSNEKISLQLYRTVHEAVGGFYFYPKRKDQSTKTFFVHKLNMRPINLSIYRVATFHKVS